MSTALSSNRRGPWALALLALAGGCDLLANLGQRAVVVNYTLDGREAGEACRAQGAAHVVARARWTDANGAPQTSESETACDKGSITVNMGAAGTVQLTAYDADSDSATVMGVSAPTSLDPATAGTEAAATVDIIPLRGTIAVTVTCNGVSCANTVVRDGPQAPKLKVFLDTSGRDLEQVDEQAMTVNADGRLVATTHRAMVEAITVLRAEGYSTAGELLRAEQSVRLSRLNESVTMDMRPAIVTHDAGFHPVDGGFIGGTSSSSAAASASAAASSSAAASGSAGGSSGGPASGSAGASSSAAASGSVGSSSGGGSSSMPAASSSAASSSGGASSAMPVSSSAAPSSSAGVSSSAAPSSSAGVSSSAAPSSSADVSSSAAPSSSAAVSSSAAASGSSLAPSSSSAATSSSTDG